MIQINDLLAIIFHAEKSGYTDEEQAKLDAEKRIIKEIQNAITREHVNNGGPLDTLEALKSVAIALGLTIQANRTNVFGGIIIATELCRIILIIAAQDEGEDKDKDKD